MAGLSIRSLRVFDAIILSGTLGSAAKLLNTSISAASRQLLELEHDIGMTLFERTNRQLKPTAGGLRFHSEVQHILHGLNDLPGIVEAIKTEERETLSVICVPRLSLGLLAPVQAAFTCAQPHVKIETSILRRHDIQRWAASRPFDIGIGMLPVGHQLLSARPLAEVRAAVLMRDGHPLFEASHISLEELNKTPTIGYQPGLVVRSQVDDIYRKCELRAHHITETSSTLLACRLAMEGVGAAIVDYATAYQFLDNPKMRLAPLDENVWWRIGTFALASRQKASRWTLEFGNTLYTTIRQLSDRSGEALLRPIDRTQVA